MTIPHSVIIVARSVGATHLSFYCKHYAADRDVYKLWKRMSCPLGLRWHYAYIGWRDDGQIGSWQIASEEPTDDKAIEPTGQMELFA